MLALLAIQAIIGFGFVAAGHSEITPDVYVGVDVTYGDVADVKAMIDQVSGYTNMIVVGTSKVTYSSTKLTEAFQYAYDKGLSFMSLTPSIPQTVFNSTSGPLLNRTEWFKAARQNWGDRLLGFYEKDEPGGKVLDLVTPLGSNSTPLTSYTEAASKFETRVRNGLNNVKSNALASSGYPVVTSDYGLYWFDYEAGYDVIFAEFGWNYSRQVNVALCRGAAQAFGKDWGAIICWTYTTPPYIESGEQLYDDLMLAYNNGAKYITIFDGNEGWTHGILQQEHLDALKRFWDYIQLNPRNSHPVSERTAYVLPEAYGYGFRGPSDHIWGVWGPDSLTPNITISVDNLLHDYGEKLDIIYHDPLHPDNNYGYDQLLYWYSYNLPVPEISILSPESEIYAVNNLTLAFTVNKDVTWMGYRLDNQSQVTIDGNTTLLLLPEGEHSITVYAKDEYENTVTSQTLQFNVDLPEPPPPFPTTLVVIAAGATAAVVVFVCAGLLVYFKKRRL